VLSISFIDLCIAPHVAYDDYIYTIK